MNTTSLLYDHPFQKDPQVDCWIDKWDRRFIRDENQAELKTYLHSLHNEMKHIDIKNNSNPEYSTKNMTDMDLLNDIPCYPFTCAELNDLRGGNGEQGKSIIDEEHCCLLCVKSGRKKPGCRWCFNHSNNEFAERRVYGDRYYPKPEKLHLLEKAPSYDQFMDLNRNNELFSEDTQVLLERTQNMLHSPETDRYKSFYQKIRKSRKLLTSQPHPKHPRKMNPKSLGWKAPKHFINQSSLQVYEKKDPPKEPIITVHDRSYTPKILTDFSNVQYESYRVFE